MNGLFKQERFMAVSIAQTLVFMWVQDVISRDERRRDAGPSTSSIKANCCVGLDRSHFHESLPAVYTI